MSRINDPGRGKSSWAGNMLRVRATQGVRSACPNSPRVRAALKPVRDAANGQKGWLTPMLIMEPRLDQHRSALLRIGDGYHAKVDHETMKLVETTAKYWLACIAEYERASAPSVSSAPSVETKGTPASAGDIT